MSRVFYPQARAILQVVFDGFSTDEHDSDPLVIPVLPTEARIVRNSYRQADSWELVFEANDFPVDPQLVRAGAAEIFLFDAPGITDADKARNRAQALDGAANQLGRDAVDDLLLDINQATAVDRFTFSNAPAIVGLFDEQSLDLSNDGKWVSITGQDYTDLLIKRQWKPLPSGRARRIPVGRRLDVILADILSEADTDGKLQLVVEGLTAERLPTVGKSEARGHRRGIPIQQDTSYWDVMYSLAVRYGCILYVRGLDVVLTRPQNLEEGYQRRVKVMTWGHNIESLELNRRLGRVEVPNVVIKATNPETRETITVDYPPGNFTKTKKRGGGLTKTGSKRKNSITKTEEYSIVTVFGMYDVATLRRAAETRYTLLGRGERTVRITTADLEDAAGNSLLDLHSGDAVAIEFDDFNAELIRNPEVTTGAKVAHLVGRGYGEAVATVIARTYRLLEFVDRPLRVREVSYDWTEEDGLSIEIECQDFIVVGGVRDNDARESRRAKRDKKFRSTDGEQIGPDEARKAAFVRQHG